MDNEIQQLWYVQLSHVWTVNTGVLVHTIVHGNTLLPMLMRVDNGELEEEESDSREKRKGSQ